MPLKVDSMADWFLADEKFLYYDLHLPLNVPAPSSLSRPSLFIEMALVRLYCRWF